MAGRGVARGGAQRLGGRPASRTLKIAAIGSAAGFFSGLFGVGGGSVMVPLLVLWLAYDERAATGTSLAAIVFIAVFAASTQALYGNVRVLDALLVGLPAVAGVVFGTWLQQRIHARAIPLLFSLVLVASAVELVLR
ncbi:MAG TPA: sulfite exporter TauE/SafE family protein [Solirubrobacteraceae bacterium]|nr:sulfite exporter TauE/SafE family protein [Solirubrobacteraceae bacterium]